MTFSSFNFRRLFMLFPLGLLLMGQSCSISIGTGRAADGGVFRSDDRGQTWHQRVFVSQSDKKTITLGDVTVRTFVFEPGNSQHLYLGTRENGIWQSLDRGDHWKPTSLRSGDYQCLDFDPSNHEIMYTASGSAVLKSLDAGQSWTVVYTESQPGNAVTCIAVDPVNGRFVWAFTNGGKVLRSDDYGQTWTLQQVLAAFEPRLIHVEPDGSGRIEIFSRTSGIFIGDNHGATWTDITKNLQPFPNATDIRSVVIHSSGWYLGTAYGLLRSTDHGASWTALHTLVTPSSVPVQNVAVNPRTGQEIFITVNQKLHHTIDGGTSWAVTSLPMSRVPVLLTFDPEHDDTLYISSFKPLKK